MRRDHHEQRQERAHQRVWELLPWHATGRLDASEQRLVVGHLEACARCREELARDRALAQTLHEEAGSMPAPHPGGFARLLARIDNAHQALSPPGNWRLRLRELYRITPPPMRRLAVAQLAALLLLVIAVAWQRSPVHETPAAAVFHTLSSDTTALPIESAIRVVFAPEATESEIRSLLLEAHGQIASGPSPMGAYVIRVADSGSDSLPVVLAHLRSHGKVRLAEPVPGAVPSGSATKGSGE